MKPRLPKRPLAGWLILDKPLGVSSAQAVARVKYLLRPEKIGHAGTLDPLASGILPLALGEATKTIAFIQDARKTYRFTVRWGEERTTDDLEGTVVARSDARPTAAQITALLPRYHGLVMQAPPAYSAIKQEGERAYARARAGESLALPPRPVTIHRLEIIEHLGEETRFEMDCGKGTYVRSVARDLGRDLGVYGCVSALRRTRVGKFDEWRALTLEMLGEICDNPPASYLLPVGTALDDIPALALTADQAERLRHGQTIPAPHCPDGLYQAQWNGRLVALVAVAQGLAKVERGFNEPLLKGATDVDDDGAQASAD